MDFWLAPSPTFFCVESDGKWSLRTFTRLEAMGIFSPVTVSAWNWVELFPRSKSPSQKLHGFRSHESCIMSPNILLVPKMEVRNT